MARATKRRQNASNDGPRKVRDDVDDGLTLSDEDVQSSRTVASSTSRRITRQMTTDAPRRAVFATAELLENILLQLPAKTVIGAQRTCRQFRDIVTTSAKIREHVFLRSISEEWPPWIVQPRYHGTAFTKVSHAEAELAAKETIVTAKPIMLHPLMRSTHLYISDNHLYGAVSQTTNASLPRKFNRNKTGSWRAMYITQPPVTKGEVTMRWEIPNAAVGIVTRVVENRHGLTLGELIDGAMRQVCEDSDYFIVRQEGEWVRNFPGVNDTAIDVAERAEKAHERESTWRAWSVSLEHVIVPTLSEWKQIKGEV